MSRGSSHVHGGCSGSLESKCKVSDSVGDGQMSRVLVGVESVLCIVWRERERCFLSLSESVGFTYFDFSERAMLAFGQISFSP